MGLAKACFSLFRVGIGWYLWSWRRKEPPVAVPPASEATSRGAEHSQLLPFLMLPTPACPIKKDRTQAVIFLWSWRESNLFHYYTDSLVVIE